MAVRLGNRKSSMGLPLPSNTGTDFQPTSRYHKYFQTVGHLPGPGGNGYYLKLPPTNSADLKLFNASGTEQWSKTAENFNAFVASGNGGYVGFYYDASDALLYVLIERWNVDPHAYYLHTINASGTMVNIGADAPTSNFNLRDYGWGNNSFYGGALYRHTDGSGDFVWNVGFNNSTVANHQTITIDSSDGTFGEPAALWSDTPNGWDNGTSLPGYYNSNGIGIHPEYVASYGDNYTRFCNRNTGAQHTIMTADSWFPSNSGNTRFYGGHYFGPWGGYMNMIGDDEWTLPNRRGHFDRISKSSFDTWLDDCADFFGIAS